MASEKSEIPTEYLPDLKIPVELAGLDIERLGKEKVDSLKDAIKEIHDMIEERKRLSIEFVRQGEAMKTEITNFLKENAVVGEDDTEFARERAELRKKQIEISESQQQERINSWKDIAELKKELREREKELYEKESRAQMLGKILGA